MSQMKIQKRTNRQPRHSHLFSAKGFFKPVGKNVEQGGISSTSILPPVLTPIVDFARLPLHPHDPPYSAWGLWSDEDELGTLNHLTESVVRCAAQEVKTGQVVPLNLPLDCPVVPMNPRRTPCSHNIIAKGYANDDEIHLNTQSSSHWDGLRHYPYQGEDVGERRYYNGVTQDDVSGPRKNDKIGIQNVAQRGIVGRGVLLDWRSWAVRHNKSASPFTRHGITLSDLLQVAEEQRVVFRPGDILLIRSGWIEEYQKLSREQQLGLAAREGSDRAFIGVQASEEMLRWHWEMQFSAVAGDTNAYEVWPPSRELNSGGVSCHEVFLSGWGMPIGEVWDLERLSDVCRDLGRWTFFLTSCPLNLSAGVASPANVMVTF